MKYCITIYLVLGFTINNYSQGFQIVEPKSLAGYHNFAKPQDEPKYYPNFTEILCCGEVAISDPIAPCNDIIDNNQYHGKIVIMQSSSCDLSLKIKSAQDAGAIGVIIYRRFKFSPLYDDFWFINNSNPVILNIPLVAISHDLGNQIISILEKEVVKVCFGNIKFETDLAINNKEDIYYCPMPTIPHWLIQSQEGYKLNVGIKITNKGKTTIQNPKAKFELSYLNQNSNMLESQSEIIFDEGIKLDQNQSWTSFLDQVELKKPQIGRYVISYNTYSSHTEQFTQNNQYNFHFDITENILSRSRWNSEKNTPVMTTGIRIEYQELYPFVEIMTSHELQNCKGKFIDSLIIGIADFRQESFSSEYLEAYIYEWTDLNGDGITDQKEVEILAFGDHIIDLSKNEFDYYARIKLTDYNSSHEPFIFPNNNAHIIIGIRCDPNAKFYFGVDDGIPISLDKKQQENANTYATRYLFSTSFDDSRNLPNFNGRFTYGLFVAPLSIGLKFSDGNNQVSTKDSDQNPFIKVYPNPADDLFYIKFSDEIILNNPKIELINMIGEIVTVDIKNSNGKKLIVNTSNLASGAYLIKINNQGKSHTQIIHIL